MDRMDPNYQQQYGFNVHFDEGKSIKIKQLREFLTSKWTLAIIASIGIIILFSFVGNVINYVQTGISSGNSTGLSIFYAVMESALELIFVILFLIFVVNLYKNKDKEEVVFLYRLEILRKYIKIYLIISLLFNLMAGLVYSNIKFYYANYPEVFKDMVLTETQLNNMTILGYNNILKAGIYAVLTFAVGKCYKLIYRRIAVPRRDNELIDYYILIGILIVFGLTKIVGAGLECASIHTILSYKIIDFTYIGDYFLVIELFLEGLFFIYMAYYTYLVRQLLVNMPDDEIVAKKPSKDALEAEWYSNDPKYQDKESDEDSSSDK